MENQIHTTPEEHNIIVSDDKVEVVYTNVGADKLNDASERIAYYYEREHHPK
jgi:hypothetical protein